MQLLEYIVAIICIFSKLKGATRVNDTVVDVIDIAGEGSDISSSGIQNDAWRERIMKCADKSPWTHLKQVLNKPSSELATKVVNQVQARVASQGLIIQQGGEGFCAHVTLENALVLSQPAFFADLIADLFCDGSSKGNQYVIPEPVFQCEPHGRWKFQDKLSGIPIVDFIFSAALGGEGVCRGDGLAMDTVEKFANQFFPGTQIQVLDDGGSKNPVQSMVQGTILDPTTHHVKQDTWRNVEGAVLAGGYALLMVGKGAELRSWNGKPNHEVLLTNILVGEGDTDLCSQKLLAKTRACVVWTWATYYVYENCDNLRKNVAHIITIKPRQAMKGPQAFEPAGALYRWVTDYIKVLYHARLDQSWKTSSAYTQHRKKGLNNAISIGPKGSRLKLVPWNLLGDKQKKAGFQLKQIDDCNQTVIEQVYSSIILADGGRLA
eukprot:gnl/TRDRNA2_/TRDRNA2_152680_c1_seq2.p1 gnl/TRDRNA2_/TRDRNA2_152680_c1~~gnl/TRDRNA2_/TRDRNA2_152680_c1_seq2.p1  ORF type:complete len:435 (+),score=51.56 gnl/TRDRNA2_/TRDRNA2_152680_c1_seq2:51-1355(+)